jgi:hypothetical protein
MSDPTIILRPRSINVDNGQRLISQRGKRESSLLVILPGTSAASVNDVRPRVGAEILEQYQSFNAWKGSAVVTTLTNYPQDILSGWDNFLGYGEPAAPFIRQRVASGVILLTNYGPYDAAQDLLGHRSIDFEIEPPFNQGQQQYLLTALVYPPPPDGDLSTQYHRPQEFTDSTFTDQPNRGAWHIVLMPEIAPPPPNPPVPFPYIPNTATVDVRLKVGYQPWKVHRDDVIG